MLTLTGNAQIKVKEILEAQTEPYAGLRVQVVGGGCSGFQYHMGFEKQPSTSDEVLWPRYSKRSERFHACRPLVASDPRIPPEIS